MGSSRSVCFETVASDADDGDGQHCGAGECAQKTTAAETGGYVYGITGEQVAEVNASGGWSRGEVYAGGKHLATYANDTTYFNHIDWLGTERARTTVSASSCEAIVSLAFGDGTATTGSCSDASPMHFTGKQHDDESNLDDFDARYYSSEWGRFISVDPSRTSVDPYNPQSWNRYAYTLDDPLGYVDHNGLWPTSIHNEIYEFVFGWSLSHDQLSLIERVSAQQDSLFGGGQSAKNANSHAMCSPNQNMAGCKSGIANHINSNLTKAKAIGAKQGLTNEALTYFAVAAHTLTDEGSPEHTDASGNPITWHGVITPYAVEIPSHVMGEDNEAQSWSGIGQSITNVVNAFFQTFPEDAHRIFMRFGPNAVAGQAIENMVDHYYYDLPGSSEQQTEMARECALGKL